MSDSRKQALDRLIELRTDKLADLSTTDLLLLGILSELKSLSSESANIYLQLKENKPSNTLSMADVPAVPVRRGPGRPRGSKNEASK